MVDVREETTVELPPGVSEEAVPAQRVSRSGRGVAT